MDYRQTAGINYAESNDERKKRIAELVAARLEEFKRGLVFVGGNRDEIAAVQRHTVNCSRKGSKNDYSAREARFCSTRRGSPGSYLYRL